MVVQPVPRAFQVYAHDGMPGLELVEPRGRPLLRPGWGWICLPFFLENVAPAIELSPLHHDRASGHFFSEPLRFRCAREVGGKGHRTPLAYTGAGIWWCYWAGSVKNRVRHCWAV